MFNNLLKNLQLLKNCRVEYLIDYDKEGIFYIDYTNYFLVVKLLKDSTEPDQTLLLMKYNIESSITIYSNSKMREAILSVVNKFLYL